MADFNSAYTGAEIDAAIAKTATILSSVQVYSGSPTNTGIPMSSISLNPDTGDKTGTYDVIYSDNNTSVDTASGKPNAGRIWIGNEGQDSGGSGHGGFGESGGTVTFYENAVNYAGSTDATFHAISKSYVENSGTVYNINIYIHKIFRLQKS